MKNWSSVLFDKRGSSWSSEHLWLSWMLNITQKSRKITIMMIGFYRLHFFRQTRKVYSFKTEHFFKTLNWGQQKQTIQSSGQASASYQYVSTVVTYYWPFHRIKTFNVVVRFYWALCWAWYGEEIPQFSPRVKRTLHMKHRKIQHENVFGLPSDLFYQLIPIDSYLFEQKWNRYHTSNVMPCGFDLYVL